MFFHLVQLDLVQHRVAFHQALLYIDDTLVARTAELDVERALGHDERAVDEDVGIGKQVQERRGFVPVLLQIFERVSRKDYEVQATVLDFAGKRNERRRLVHRVATAKSDAVEQRVLVNHRKDFFNIDKMPAVEIVRLRVLAAGTVVMASLRKDRHTDARTVHEGFGLYACNAKSRSFLFHFQIYSLFATKKGGTCPPNVI